MIRIEEGYCNPDENQRVIVKLEDGTITGAVYKPMFNLEDPKSFEPVEFGLTSFEYGQIPIAWKSIPKEWLGD